MLSRIAYILSSIVILYTSFIFFPRWNQPDGNAVIEYDVKGYYWYLPAALIYNDIKANKTLDTATESAYINNRACLFKHTASNTYIDNYTVGMAIMYLPFFTAAHVLAKPLGYPPDGFSTPYTLALQIGGVFIALIGLWYYRKVLLKFYDDRVTSAMLLLLVIGTNYLNYTAIDFAYTHNWLFTLYVLLILNTHNFYKTPKNKYAVRLGLILGLLILIRPTEIIAVLIPLLWGIESIGKDIFTKKIQFLRSNLKHLISVTCIIMLLGSIQIAYWWYVTGQPLVYSYDEKGFSWLHPHFYNYIFSARSGWLSYTPLLAFSFIGIIPFLRYGKHKVMVLTIFALSLYITSAWDIWWYGGTGGRAMIQVYPVILFPFAALINHILNRSIKWVILPFLLLFTYINIWFTYNAHAGDGLYSEGMTSAYYWHVIGRFYVPEHTKIYKDTDEYFDGQPKNLRLLYKEDFEGDTTESNIHVIDGNRSAYIDGSREFGPMIKIPYNNNTQATWIRANLDVLVQAYEWDTWKMIQYTVGFSKNGASPFKNNIIRINRYSSIQEVNHLYFDVKIPESDFDTIRVWLWNPASTIPTIVDNIEIYSFEE